MTTLRLLAAVVVISLGFLGGCGGGSSASGAAPTVVTAFYPLHYVAERIAGEHANVENLTSPGVEPHDLELTVQQTTEVADVDVAFYQKGFQPAVDEAIEQSGPDQVVETTEVVPFGDDPHFWLDPIRLSEVAAAFEQEMARVDPEHAADYARNLNSLQADLATLDTSYRTGLAQCEISTVVVSHDAFGYLAKYGPEFEPISGLSPDAEPSPVHIAELQELVKSQNLTTVFSETLASPELADTLADDLGIETRVLDPIEGLGETTADEDYLSLMRQNLSALQEANRCP